MNRREFMIGAAATAVLTQLPVVPVVDEHALRLREWAEREISIRETEAIMRRGLAPRVLPGGGVVWLPPVIPGIV